MGAAREHGIIDALTVAGVDTVADTPDKSGGPAMPSTPRTPVSAAPVSGSTPS
jgi:hypothetical protein